MLKSDFLCNITDRKHVSIFESASKRIDNLKKETRNEKDIIIIRIAARRHCSERTNSKRTHEKIQECFMLVY